VELTPGICWFVLGAVLRSESEGGARSFSVCGFRLVGDAVGFYDFDGSGLW
jgi:hypothetical protein